MTPSRTARLDHLLGQLAREQHGVVAWWQLRDHGVPYHRVRSRVERGLLVPVHRGVFAAAWAPTTRDACWWAALLACGPGALLSHLSAATSYGLRREPWRPVHVLAERSFGHRVPGVTTHRSASIDPADRFVRDGIPITGMALTLIDCAALLDAEELRRTVERVPRLDARTMRRCLDRHPARRGTRRMDEVLRAYEDRTRSWLERRFLSLCRAHGIAKPAVNVVIEGRERDFAWADRRLVVEADGQAFHASRAQRADDHRRDLELRLAGWTVQRFTYEAIVLTPGNTAAAVQGLLRAVPR